MIINQQTSVVTSSFTCLVCGHASYKGHASSCYSGLWHCVFSQ